MNLEPVPQAQIDQHATSLRELELEDISRIQLIAELYMAIQQASEWFDHDCPNLAARFNHYAAFKNQAVEFEHHSGLCSGIFLGIQDDGSVNIETAEGLKKFYQGRLRRLDTPA